MKLCISIIMFISFCFPHLDELKNMQQDYFQQDCACWHKMVHLLQMLWMKSWTSTDRPARTYALAFKESRSKTLRLFLWRYIMIIVYDQKNGDLNSLKIGWMKQYNRYQRDFDKRWERTWVSIGHFPNGLWSS